MKSERIYLSPPFQSGKELEAFRGVLDSNWLAPVGPQITLFEQEICKATGFKYAVATSSATSALHLGLQILEVQKGDAVISSDLTFVGAVNPIMYQGARPVFIDADQSSWNMDLGLLETTLSEKPDGIKTIIPTHLYGMPLDVIQIESLGHRYNVPILHDLAESFAGQVQGKKVGELVQRGVYSFNGNKLITTSGGGAFVTNDKSEAELALYLATQAKSDNVGYHHESIGYNYRLSNVLAALGIEQLRTLEERIKRKAEIFELYREALEPIGCVFQQEPEGIQSDRWLTCLLLNEKTPITVEEFVKTMSEFNIETRPLWKPMHLQPVFHKEQKIGGTVVENLYAKGVCLPSGVGLTYDQQSFVISKVVELIS